MDIIISGLGAVGTILMQELADEGHNIVVVDINGSKVENAVEKYDVKGVIGNGASSQVLKEGRELRGFVYRRYQSRRAQYFVLYNCKKTRCKKDHRARF